MILDYLLESVNGSLGLEDGDHVLGANVELGEGKINRSTEFLQAVNSKQTRFEREN